MKTSGTITVTRYNAGMARMGYKGRHNRIYAVRSKIAGYHVCAGKHYVDIKIPKGHKLAYNLPEGDWLGHEGLVLVSAININPALFGRE